MSWKRYDRLHVGEDACAPAYRRTVNRLGLVLLVFLVLFTGLHLLADVICGTMLGNASTRMETVVIELCDSAAYLLSFMLPVALFHRLTPSAERQPMLLSPTLPKKTWLILPAGVAVICVAATVNSSLLTYLGWTADGNTGIVWYKTMDFYEGVLMLISSALVPAFCEELLFRGTVLSALRPYGKTTAVLGSALLFGLMHQTPDQLLYTVAAGVVLALVTLESGSIWCAVLLHMFNNLFAMVETILYEQLSSTVAMRVYSVLEILVIGGGLICLVVLIAHRTDEVSEESGVLPDHPVRGFFTPLMTCFAVLCLAQIAALIMLTYL